MDLHREVRNQLNGSELNQHDIEQETLWDTITATVETLRDKLTEGIKFCLKQVLKLADGQIPAITAIVSCVVTLMTSLITLAIQYNSTTVKIALGASILAALTAFISNVALLIKPFARWDEHKARDTAIELTTQIAADITEQPDVVANSVDFRAWTTLGITSLVAILFAGIGLSGAASWRSLLTGSNLLEGIKKTSNNMQQVADFVLRDLVGIELDRDYPQCMALEKLAEEGTKLQQYSVADFIQNPNYLYQLKSYSAKLVTVTAQKFSPENSRRYTSVRQLLIEIYRQLSQKLDAVNAILATKPRQVTIGLMLSGAPGVGKSEFGKYICKRVAKVLGYPTDLYCLNKKTDGFYEPYGGAALGVFNEFMAVRGEDPILRDLNLILSSDPMNFEAACLEGKSQPCQLKLAFLTSNSHNPEVVRVLAESAVRAMWDRIYHISVEDPLCAGRHQPNKHRKPDFTHLKFNRVEHTSPDNILFHDTDLKTIEERLIARCAMEERHHIQQLLKDDLEPEVALSLNKRSEALSNLLLTANPYDIVTPNALGREFFITRLQGIPGSGKSTLAEQLARGCSNLFNYPIQFSRDEKEFNPVPTPMIYVIDDWVEERNVESFVQLMNKTHERSMFFVTSNSTFQRVGWRTDFFGSAMRCLGSMAGLTTACPWDASSVSLPDGVMRRIGLQGFIRLKNGQMIQTPEIFQMTFNCCENFVIRDAYMRVGHKEQLLDTIFKNFRTFLAMPGEYTLIKGLPPAMKDPGVTLEAPNATILLEGLRSPAKCMAAYLGRANGFKLLVSDRLKGPQASSQTMAASWMVVEEPTDDPVVLESVWARLCAVFNKTFPGEPLLLRLTESESTYYYESGVAYYFTPTDVHQSIPVEILDEGIIFHRDSNTPVRITFEQFAAARLYNQFDGPMRNVSVAEFRAINRAFTALQSIKPNSVMALKYANEEQRATARYSPRSLWFETELKSNPIFWVGVSLISLVCAGGMIYGFIRLCQVVHHSLTSKTPSTHANSDDVEEGKGYKPAQKVIRKITFHNSDDVDEGKGFKPAKKILRKIGPRPNFYYDYVAPEDIPWDQSAEAVIHALNKQMETGQHAEYALRELLTLHPEWKKHMYHNPWLDTIYSNMLQLEDMVKSPPSDIEVFHESIRKSYVHVSSPSGVCYGVHLKDGYILTVSHMFKDYSDSVVLRCDYSEYSGEVVLLDRERDLAVVRVTDKQWKALPATRRFFIPMADLNRPKYGFFLRCGPQCQTMGGLVTYYKSTTVPITSSENPNYRLSSKLIVHIATALDKTTTFIRMGDCGFPMVCKSRDGLRITGIHNGYNQSEKSYYSSFTCEDFDDFITRASAYKSVQPNIRPYDSNAEELNIYELVDQEHVGVLPVTYAEAIENCTDEHRYTQFADTLHILGYSSTLAIRSRPKCPYKPIELDERSTQRLTLPAAFSMKYVTDDCSLARSAKGIPSPLFTQCLKYDARVPVNFDTYIYEEAVGIVMQDCVARYGGCRFLRLHETLNGISEESLPPIDTRTSAGPLLKILYGVQTKEPIFDVRTPERGRPTLVFREDCPPASMVRNHYYQYYNTLVNKFIPPIMISKDCAKVELIDADKAAAGKVRLFNEVDLSINLLFRSLFGQFSARVMDQHLSAPIRMGQDPYVAATAICRQFNEIYGTVVSTDFSSFDKQLPLELIYAFCWIVSRCMTKTGRTQDELDNIYSAIARTLTYVVHTCRGTIYVVDRGNESGTFVTTLLNSISVDILTSYTLCRKWLSIFKFVPTMSELATNCRKAILGDDRALKVSSILEITQEDLIQDSNLFGLKCTPAKTDCGLDFCSRALEWDPITQVSFPALKVSSVTSQLHWTTSFTEEQLLQNCDNAIFEAALHADPAFFNACLTDALGILRKYQIPLEKLRFHSRETIRQRFALYIRNDGTTPKYAQVQEATGREDPITYVYKSRRAHDIIKHKTYLQICEQEERYFDLLYYLGSEHFDASTFTNKWTQEAILKNPKAYIQAFQQNFGLKLLPEVTISAYPQENKIPVFKAHLKFYDLHIFGEAFNKRSAERDVYLQLIKGYFPPFSKEGVRCNDKTTIDISENIGPRFQCAIPINYDIIDYKHRDTRRRDPNYHNYVLDRLDEQDWFDVTFNQGLIWDPGEFPPSYDTDSDSFEDSSYTQSSIFEVFDPSTSGSD